MKTRLFSVTAITTLLFALVVAGCSKKSEHAAPAPAPAQAPTTPSADAARAITDAAEAKLAAAKKEAEAIQAQAENAAKAKLAEAQALADQKTAEAKVAAEKIKQQATDASNALLSKASAFKADALAVSSAAPASSTASATSATPVPSSTSLQSLAQNLTPANFSAWYDKASAESSGVISSLATKAAELGSQASPEFKSLYDTALVQKKNFDDISSQIKTGGLTQWAQLYPKLQSSWGDLSKSLTTAKSLLAQYSK